MPGYKHPSEDPLHRKCGRLIPVDAGDEMGMCGKRAAFFDAFHHVFYCAEHCPKDELIRPYIAKVPGPGLAILREKNPLTGWEEYDGTPMWQEPSETMHKDMPNDL